MATKLNSLKNLNTLGFTLIELMIGSSISLITILACYEIVTRSTQNYLTISAASVNIVETLHAVTTIKRKISLAVNVESVVSVSPLLSLKKGQLVDIDLSAWAPSNGDGSIVTVFSGFIDSLKSNYTNPPPSRFNRFIPMAIFFQKPTVDRYGVIYITLGDASSKKLLPINAAFKYDQIVDLKIKNSKDSSLASSLGRISKFNLEITRRSFNLNTSNRNFKWCPPAKMNIPECVDTAAYKDHVEFATVNLRNNVIEKNSAQQKIYKLTSSPPDYIGTPKRFIDGVYFFDSAQSAESLKR